MTSLLLAIALSLPCAPPVIELPTEVKAEPGDFIQVPASTSGKSVKWVPLDPGLSLFPTELLKDTRIAVVIAKTPGRYRLLALTCAGDELADPAITTIIVGEGDVLGRAIQTAYGQEMAEDKAELAKALAALYRQAAQDAFLRQPHTWGQLYKAMTDAAGTLGVSGKIKKVQTAIAAELVAKLPSKDAFERGLDEAGRQQAAEVFTRISKALESCR